ncbi:MAG: hypothetical protein IJ689_00050 [Alphaproteobacteria bacterium]|nr:hypothetical protein [Alphaproteobacteria bacterium]
MSEQFVIFDTEYASWQGFIDLALDDPLRKTAEIVQIAALKINLNDLSVKEEFNCYIKPHFKPKLSDYFIELTGISDELLDEKGVDFLSAFKHFCGFADGLVCYSHAWGQKYADEVVIKNNLELFGCDTHLNLDFRNIAPWFEAQYRKRGMNIAKQSSGQICKILDTKRELSSLNLDEHNALFDVYSLLSGLRCLGFSSFF